MPLLQKIIGPLNQQYQTILLSRPRFQPALSLLISIFHMLLKPIILVVRSPPFLPKFLMENTLLFLPLRSSTLTTLHSLGLIVYYGRLTPITIRMCNLFALLNINAAYFVSFFVVIFIAFITLKVMHCFTAKCIILVIEFFLHTLP